MFLYVIVCTWIISYNTFPVEFMDSIRPHFYKGLKNPLTYLLTYFVVKKRKHHDHSNSSKVKYELG